MGASIGHFIQLLLLANLGVFLACRLLKYDIPDQRKVIAASAFALLYSLPLPIGVFIHVVPPIALWILLKDPDVGPVNRLPVFLLTYLFAALMTLMLFKLTRS